MNNNYITNKMRALVIEHQNITPNSFADRATKSLIAELQNRSIEIITATSYEDARAVILSTQIDSLVLALEKTEEQIVSSNEEVELLSALQARQSEVPVFLLAERARTSILNNRQLMERVDECYSVLEDTADFVAGRIVASMRRYRAQVLPPFMKAMMHYNNIHEYSWSAPGHQGGIGFTKTPAGNQFFEFFGENLFRTDMGIERAALGSLLDHSGAFKDSEVEAAKIFGAHQSYSGIVGTSGSNRTIMQACMKDDDIAICDRNCHKSIEQGLILTGARPIYMVPSRNCYGIIGPISKVQMSKEGIALKAKNAGIPFNADEKKASYAVVTNCTYDGLCYHSEVTEALLGESSSRIHMDEAWFGYARFNPIYKGHYAMRGDAKDHTGPTVFATHSTHKLLNALSQASYIHVRNGENAINFDRFNQAYMMHTSTSPLYAICASNDVAANMMKGESGLSLTNEVNREAIVFRQSMRQLFNDYTAENDWFFKPWNAETVTEMNGDKVNFEDASVEALMTIQQNWKLTPGDKWHGFDEIDNDWCMLDPIKVSLLTPGLDDNGKFLETGVPAALVTAYLGRFGIVPTRTTDFQVMFLFSMGITKGKRDTLINTLLSFKRHYDANSPLETILPELVASSPATYSGLGLRDLGERMFKYLVRHNPSQVLNHAYSSLPVMEVKPRTAYQFVVSDDVELVASNKLVGRVAANSVIPYPPGIPMLMGGENFGDDTSPQIQYLKALEAWDAEFPGFEHETEGAEIEDGKYHVLCIKKEAL
ncbi:arginine decarboxylase [Photobacterium phosphoreum]|uniref:arginine decarboxylase n=2 Tax=Photobacterium phosphoreum TaxID=659 RepID=UPI000D1867EF|nr:arginine decarboxylase [Photobacterium phosphoreum]MCD9485259.1 arginine decarboxylase [Photobacterium phosphoreum]MCD9508904.1 arginine decarboxylase [Photobacterium phosphoreum]PSU34527.1 arginine decarboxylase [Photobacterium phosphoreum]PSU75908.1 arginine decarboxylase [Photobacterium phosphoreum]